MFQSDVFQRPARVSPRCDVAMGRERGQERQDVQIQLVWRQLLWTKLLLLSWIMDITFDPQTQFLLEQLCN